MFLACAALDTSKHCLPFLWDLFGLTQLEHFSCPPKNQNEFTYAFLVHGFLRQTLKGSMCFTYIIIFIVHHCPSPARPWKLAFCPVSSKKIQSALLMPHFQTADKQMLKSYLLLLLICICFRNGGQGKSDKWAYLLNYRHEYIFLIWNSWSCYFKIW